MNILYWNIKNNSISYIVSRCLFENEIDFAVFSEYTDSFFEDIIKETRGDYRVIEGNLGCRRVKAIIKNSIKAEVLREDSRVVIYQLVFDGKKYIIAGVHLHDRRNYGSDTRKTYIRKIIEYVLKEENDKSCDNTIIIGDLNSNPYDTEILGFDGFNAVLFKDIIFHNEYRIHDETKYRRFYNPILDYLSEDNSMYGSFYDTSSDNTSIWCCLDQALFRKPLANSVVELKYLRKIGSTSLIKSVQPDSMISDHLPLYVKIK